jgi:hypothetical protein
LEVFDILMLTQRDEVELAQREAFEGLVKGCFPRKMGSASYAMGDLAVAFMSGQTERVGGWELGLERP